MKSTFTWLDYSEHERRKMLDVIEQFREKGTLDELGIGSVRDAFADLFFPGTSTIQTRARYFLFIPWIYQSLEQDEVPSRRVDREARKCEIELIDALMESGDTSGVIGQDARANLQRLPSNIYWQGLGVWGIRTFQGSQHQYHRSLDNFYLAQDRYRQLRREHAKEREFVDEPPPRNWHANLPPIPHSFPNKASLGLRRQDADYLYERVMTSTAGTLLASMVDRSLVDDIEYPWDLKKQSLMLLSPQVRSQLNHARNFSEVIQGAALLYNLMLAEQIKSSRLINRYRDWLKDWAKSLEKRMDVLRTWNRDGFWKTVQSGDARITHPTMDFVNVWLDLAINLYAPKQLAENSNARQLIRNRERLLKRALARLDNPRARELWNEDAGTSQLDYRWRQARRIIADICEGLSREVHDA